MAYYYKIDDSGETFPLYKGFHLQKVKKSKGSGPKIDYDFSKHVLVELLDDTTPEEEIWRELGLINDKSVIHKRMMVDCHRIKCRRAIVICSNADEAKKLAKRISQTKIKNRCVCASVIEDLLSDLCLFEKQIMQFGDDRQQQQLLYVSDLSRTRGPSGLVTFLKEKFSSFGTILSVLVCSDNDGYAYPEGVVKFAYLSEAFAAELAFDQFVVGKERLSVTTHHNILLSQCDLRVRLRDAQWRNNFECNGTAISPFNSYQEPSKLNKLDVTEEDPELYSMNNLQISRFDNPGDNSISGLSELLLPAFSQVNFEKNISKEDCDSDINPTESPICDFVETSKNFEMSQSNNMSQTTNKSHEIKFKIPRNISSDQVSESTFHSSKIKNCETSSKYESKYSKDVSDSISFITCKDFPDSCSNSVISYSKKTLYNSVQSEDIFSISEYQSVTSESKLQISSSCNNNSKGSRNAQESAAKGSNKRKKYTPSQKLCLKSQRTDINQSSILSTCNKSSVSNSNFSKIEKSKETHVEKNVNLTKLSRNAQDSSRVIDWLSHLPENDGTTLPYENIENMDVDIQNQKVTQNAKQLKNRISIHRAPSIKTNSFIVIDKDDSWSDSSVENQDPNINSVISGNKEPSPLIDKSKTPLQAWLKQELTSCTNNRAIKSQETLKSVILCAARTKDVIIAVGCSHMTCDSCYPESTDLLLGYN